MSKLLSIKQSMTGPSAHTELMDGSQFSTYIIGYTEAIHCIFEKVSNHSHSNAILDTMHLPLMMCIHQWLELNLKSIMWEARCTTAELTDSRPKVNRSKDRQVSFDIHKTGHELIPLSNSAIDHAKKICPEGCKIHTREEQQIRMFVNEISELSSSGFEWRYPYQAAVNKEDSKKIEKDIFLEVKLSSNINYYSLYVAWKATKEAISTFAGLAANRPCNTTYTNRTKSFYPEPTN